MRNMQAEGRVPGSSANSLPTVLYSPKRHRNSAAGRLAKIVSNLLICRRLLTSRRRIPRVERCFFPAVREMRQGEPSPEPAARRRGAAIQCMLTGKDQPNPKTIEISTVIRHPAIPPVAGNP